MNRAVTVLRIIDTRLEAGAPEYRHATAAPGMSYIASGRRRTRSGFHRYPRSVLIGRNQKPSSKRSTSSAAEREWRVEIARRGYRRRRRLYEPRGSRTGTSSPAGCPLRRHSRGRDAADSASIGCGGSGVSTWPRRQCGCGQAPPSDRRPQGVRIERRFRRPDRDRGRATAPIEWCPTRMHDAAARREGNTPRHEPCWLPSAARRRSRSCAPRLLLELNNVWDGAMR